MNAEHAKTLSMKLIPHVATIATTVVVSYFAFRGETYKADRVAAGLEIQAFLQRITALEGSVRTVSDEVSRLTRENALLKAENTNLTVRIGMLMTQIETGNDSPLQAIFRLLESLQVPAWCKRYEPGSDAHFEMAYINHRYEVAYDVTKARYIGSTDFDVHPVKLAQAYNENDLMVYKQRRWMDFVEPFARDGVVTEYRYWKFYHQVQGGPELVCGWQVPNYEEPAL